MVIKKLIIALIIFIGLMIVALPLEAAIFKVKKEVRVKGSFVKIADVVDIVDASDSLKKRIERSYLGRAPKIGKCKKISLDYLKLRLRQLHIDSGRIKFEGAKEILIIRTLKEVDPAYYKRKDLIELKIKELICKKFDRDGSKDVVITIGSVSKKLEKLPKGKMKVERVSIVGDKRLRGKMGFEVLVNINDTWRNLYIVAEVKVYWKVVVAVKRIRPGRVIRADDVVLKSVDRREGSNGCLSLSSVIGSRCKKRINRGEVVRKSMVKPQALVKRGDMVVCKYRSGEIYVEVSGIKAMQNGYLDQRIRVRNVKSKKEYLAEVVGKGEVRIIE